MAIKREVYEVRITRIVEATTTVLVEASSVEEAYEAARERDNAGTVELEVLWETAQDAEFQVVEVNKTDVWKSILSPIGEIKIKI